MTKQNETDSKAKEIQSDTVSEALSDCPASNDDTDDRDMDQIPINHSGSMTSTDTAAAAAADRLDQWRQSSWKRRWSRTTNKIRRRKRVVGAHERKVARKLAKLLHIASELLLDRLFRYLSSLPEQAANEDDADVLQQQQSTASTPISGLSLPATAIGWLASQLYPDESEGTVMASEASSLVSDHDDDENHEHRNRPFAANFTLSASTSDRLSLLKFLLPRLTYLRITTQKWPVKPRKNYNNNRMLSLSSTSRRKNEYIVVNNNDDDDDDDYEVWMEGFLSNVVTENATDLIRENNHDTNDNNSNHQLVASFLDYFESLVRRPRVDLRLFPNLQALLIDQVPPDWLHHLGNFHLRRSLQVLRMERGGIFDLAALFSAHEHVQHSMSQSLLSEDELLQQTALAAPASSNEYNNDDSNEHRRSSTKQLVAIQDPLQPLLLPKHQHGTGNDTAFLFANLTHLKLSYCGLTDTSGLVTLIGNKNDNQTEPNNQEKDVSSRLYRRKRQDHSQQSPLAHMLQLRSISLSHNQLSSARVALDGLTNKPFLSKVDLSHNCFTRLHTAHYYIGNIQTLLLSHNKLTTTTGIDRLFALETLFLDHNCLEDVASIRGLARLANLQRLRLSNNPLARNRPVAYRVEVLDLFREQRMLELSSNCTYRELQAALPRLDDKLASYGELKALKERTYASVSIPVSNTAMNWNLVEEDDYVYLHDTSSPFMSSLRQPLLSDTPNPNEPATITPLSSPSSLSSVSSVQQEKQQTNYGRKKQALQKVKRRRPLRVAHIRDAGDAVASSKAIVDCVVQDSALDYDDVAVPLLRSRTDATPQASFSVADVIESLSLLSTPNDCSFQTEPTEDLKNNFFDKGEKLVEACDEVLLQNSHVSNDLLQTPEAIVLDNDLDLLTTIKSETIESTETDAEREPFVRSSSGRLEQLAEPSDTCKGPEREDPNIVNTVSNEDNDLAASDKVLDSSNYDVKNVFEQALMVLAGNEEKSLSIKDSIDQQKDNAEILPNITVGSTKKEMNISQMAKQDTGEASFEINSINTGENNSMTLVKTPSPDQYEHEDNLSLKKGDSSSEVISRISKGSVSVSEQTENGLLLNNSFEVERESSLQLVTSPGNLWHDDTSSAPSVSTSNRDEFSSMNYKFSRAEEYSTYEGPPLYSSFIIVENLELYFREFVFKYSHSDNGFMSSTGLGMGGVDDEWHLILDRYPKIQLWPIDRRMRDAMKLEQPQFTLSTLENNQKEDFRRVWRENVVACGKSALKRLTPNRSPRYGFHGEFLWPTTKTQNTTPELVANYRNLILCYSNAALYFIVDHDIVAAKINDRKKTFPLPIPLNATFSDAKWPHAIARHSFCTLRCITIGFGFQRLTLRFSNTISPGEESIYILLTSDKMETVTLLKEFQRLTQDAKVAQGLPVTADDGVKIDNDDRHVLDAIGAAVAPDVLEAILHYQILQQHWKRGERGAVRRVFVVTDTKLFLLDEDYIGDGASVFEADSLSVGKPIYRLVNSAFLEQAFEVKADDSNPNAVLVSIQPMTLMQRVQNWRLLCRDRHGAERLVEDVRKAILLRNM